MTPSRIEFLGLVLATATSAACAVIALVYAVRLALRARQTESGPTPPLAPGRVARLAVRARPWVPAVLMCAAGALIAGGAVQQSVSLSHTPVPPWEPPPPPPKELTQTAEWHAWRAKVHAKLAVEPVTDQAVIDALRLKSPALSDPYTEADLLRRDQAVADVLLSYDGVRKILARRFGIRNDFLGTGLSKPLGRTPYSLASVHEYLVNNHPDTHDHVWMWKLTSLGKDVSQPLQTFLAGEPGRVAPDNAKKTGGKFDDDLKEILLRVKNPDHPIPPMIRFGRFDQKYYKGTLGRPEAARVFTSNLSEVWDLTIQQAAERSGYYYKDGGDTLFVWVYVPYQSNEFTPATWRDVLERLPEWLESVGP